MLEFLKKLLSFSHCTNGLEEIDNTNKTRKLFFTGYEQLSISASDDKKIIQVKNSGYEILKKYKDNPKQILHYINAKGTEIVVAPELLPLLKFLGYDEGFIPAHNGFKAIILNVAISFVKKEKLHFSNEIKDTFIICRKEISLYFVGYNLYHWLAYKNKLQGYEFKTLSLFKSTFANPKCNFNAISINQILSIKDAIDRDKEACDFVMKFVQEQISTKERLESILEGKKVNI